MIAWSYGGGIQSVAIGCLIVEGRLPVPDLAVIADTGREVRSTWDYLYGYMQPFLNRTGLLIEVAPHTLSRVDLYDKTGLTLMPAYTAEGRLPAFCSGEWKRDTIMRWLRSKGVESCKQWIGFSMDEIRRVPHKDRRKWAALEFPLIDLFINRAMCVGIIEAAGLPIPRKSRCWQCPHQDEGEWQEIRDDVEQWAAAVALDEQIRQNDPEQSGLFLHSSRVPLALADLHESEVAAKPCADGHCWT